MTRPAGGRGRCGERPYEVLVVPRTGETTGWPQNRVRANPVRVGADVATVDECFESILAERGVAFSQASTQRIYSRPSLAFVPVTDIPPTALSIAWRTDVASKAVRDFIDTARAVATLHTVPGAWSTRPHNSATDVAHRTTG